MTTDPLAALLLEALALFADGSDGHHASYVDHQWRCDDDCPACSWLTRAAGITVTAQPAPDPLRAEGVIGRGMDMRHMAPTRTITEADLRTAMNASDTLLPHSIWLRLPVADAQPAPDPLRAAALQVTLAEEHLRGWWREGEEVATVPLVALGAVQAAIARLRAALEDKP